MEIIPDTELYRDLISLAEPYFKCRSLRIEPLKGDGSERRIVRIHSQKSDQKPVVGVIHQNVIENRDFILLTDIFREAGLKAPEIYLVNHGKTAYLMQDLGTSTLAEKVTDWKNENQGSKIIKAYKGVLDSLVKIQNDLPANLGDFFRDRKMDVSVYQADLDYFKRDFIDRFGFQSLLTNAAVNDLQSILYQDLAHQGCDCFVYRDFQARNIMWLNDEPWFIDYQSAFLGPRYYDLSSLLYGSKSGLDGPVREELVAYFYQQLELQNPEFEEFQRLFYLFVVLRRLRSLGTYGFLAGSKGKKVFLTNIAPTLKELSELFRSQSCLKSFSGLLEMVEGLKRTWKKQNLESDLG